MTMMTTMTIIRDHVASRWTPSSSAVHRPRMLTCIRCLRRARAVPWPHSGGTSWCPSPFSQGRQAAEKPHSWKGAGPALKPGSLSSGIRCLGAPSVSWGPRPPQLLTPRPSFFPQWRSPSRLQLQFQRDPASSSVSSVSIPVSFPFLGRGAHFLRTTVTLRYR